MADKGVQETEQPVEAGSKPSATPPFSNPIKNNYFTPIQENHKRWWNSWNIFSKGKNAGKVKERDLNLLDNVSTLLSTSDVTQEEIIQTVKHLVYLHRTTENTSARKRLEKWAKRVISWYLIAILIFVCVASLKYEWMKVSDTVMITILSTTTINILGLGFIILKGHFPQNDKDGEGDCEK